MANHDFLYYDLLQSVAIFNDMVDINYNLNIFILYLAIPTGLIT